MLNYGTAMRWCKGAAGRGDKVSQCRIGLMYQTGQSIGQRLALNLPGGPSSGCDNLSQWRLAFSCLKSNRCMTRLQ